MLATGARYRKLPVPRLEEFEKTSVYYAATLMEAQLCASDPVVVVGGGNSAGQATVFLADHVGQLRLVVRERHLTEYMSRYLADSGGYLLTGADATRAVGNGSFEALGRVPLLLETNAPGVFAGGDVRSGSIKRVASASIHRPIVGVGRVVTEQMPSELG